jgi:preprotein translocase subunit YajC
MSNLFSPEVMAQIVSAAPFVLMMVIFYFLFYRPQKKEQKKREDLLNSLKKGDRIVTVGGIHGTITALTDKIVTVKVAEKVELDFSRSAVSQFQNQPKDGGK